MEASFSPPNLKRIGYPKNTIYMKTEQQIEKEIARLNIILHKGIPCGGERIKWVRNEKNKLITIPTICGEELCGRCKSKLHIRIQRRLVKQLQWVLKDEN